MTGSSGEPGPGTRQGPGQISYEQARDELTDVVRRLEAGGLTLEQSLELWERGERLADICSEWLEGARARLAAAISARSGPEAAAGGAAAPF
ncbi:MAG: exodeoxyribonuclease VII small subunit [Gemmatimonadota bacterium]